MSTSFTERLEHRSRKTLRCVAVAIGLAGVAAACGTASDPARTAEARQPALSTGGNGDPYVSCENDGICNIVFCTAAEDPDCVPSDCDLDGFCDASCASDPDCPAPETCDRSVPWPFVNASSSCEASFKVRRNAADVAVVARQFIEAKWPTFAGARFLDYDDDNDGANEGGEDCWKKGHAEANLVGTGPSLTRGTCGLIWSDIHGVEHDLLQPSLLFFEKVGADEGNWKVIGAGYHFDYAPCDVPCLDHVPESKFLIHEAGWHRVPGDGGFDCIQQQWVDGSADIDVTNQCARIDKDDFHRLGATFGANKHERLWTLHMWFQPDGDGVAFGATDPWCRWNDDGGETVVGVDCPEVDAFYPLTQDCGCSG